MSPEKPAASAVGVVTTVTNERTLTAQESARTRMKFARFRLTGHSCNDPESVPPGHWQPVHCSTYRVKGWAGKVLSSFTNMHQSDLGAPGIFTEWGTEDGIPNWASFKEVDGSACYHLAYVQDAEHVCEVSE